MTECNVCHGSGLADRLYPECGQCKACDGTGQVVSRTPGLIPNPSPSTDDIMAELKAVRALVEKLAAKWL